ncbi:hypothetical protein SBA7_530009 [Candidatus Sulfotelmatobacter sp. SbA7]|nr:hypothetical protein SBA7_530009 [Candidatus Sulfotelmatobacter sp. SbA7]
MSQSKDPQQPLGYRFAATRLAATRVAATREAATREAATREAATREAATREAATREAATREAATREAATREAAFLVAGVTDAVSAGVLAMIALLVVFRVLINDFFWIVMACSSALVLIASTDRSCLEHGPCQTQRAQDQNCQA